jgi:multiple antibiotic resistance protein
MENTLTLFVGTFTTLLAVINPLESLPIFLELLAGQDEAAHKKVARQSCIYAALLTFFFLVFGTLVLKLFSVPLSMIRIVGGIILMRIGFSLFLPSPSSGIKLQSPPGGSVAFVPLAMPLMFGPGVLATILGWSSMVQHPISNFASLISISLAIAAAMLVTYFSLAYADKLLGRIGPKGIDATTRIVGFFVSAIGMGLIFHGVLEGLQNYKTLMGS